ncbi:hypothetical protein BTA51_24870 [Hahella sp. CCB-MM4]|uniref:hypothetical protein n=1 Tax=Hahella sp. (strain CCB-MM4) TaxID=1926491 RepID=UPI000B9B8A27|nr:hypothetical protein [Hahella sp. CCB-MM4]OZG70603.1 hypothetical protein BTA51_24870 [Hahella sp. CCB-MM4]
MISGIGSSLPLLPQSRRDVTENTQEQRRELQQRSASADAERAAALEADANAAEQVLSQPEVRRAEALQGVEENRFRRQREQDELPLGNQQALNLYQSNQSTLAQDKDTGELVGIDVFV